MNTGYRPGVVGATEFDRPKSRSIFESLYPANDSDTLPLTETGGKYLIRSIYHKRSIKVKKLPTQKDLIFAVDYIKIEAINGGNNKEVAYYFVDTTATQYIGADVALLQLDIDEMTTSDCFNYGKFDGILEKRITGVNAPLNFLPVDYQPQYPLLTTVSHCTLESGAGLTRTGGLPSATGSRTLVPIYASLVHSGGATPVVNPLPAGGDTVTITVGSGAEIFSFQIKNVAFVDPSIAAVRDGLTHLRETGNQSLIGSAFTIPNQIISGTPTTFIDGTITLIIGITVDNFVFTANGMNTIDDRDAIYTQLKHKKAGYLWNTYTLTAAGSGDSKSFNIDEIVKSTTEGTTPTANGLRTSKIQISCVGIPMPSGSIYFRPYVLTFIQPTTGYDSRIYFVSSVRGSDWISDGLTVAGVEGSYVIDRQVSLATEEHSINKQQVERQLQLTKNNIARERLAQNMNAFNIGTRLASGDVTAIGSAAGDIARRFGLQQSSDTSEGFLGITAGTNLLAEREQIASQQANLALRQNLLGLQDVIWNADYARGTQGFSVQPPSGMDMARMMGSSLMITRTSLSTADKARLDLYLEWFGDTVQESYTGVVIKDLPDIGAGDSFSYIKLGVCIFTMPNEPSGWGNSASWRAKIQGELQTGGRFWHEKMIDYTWKQPIPTDDGYNPVPGGVNPPPTPVPEPSPGDPVTTIPNEDVFDLVGVPLIPEMSGYAITSICEVDNFDHFILWSKSGFTDVVSRITDGVQNILYRIPFQSINNFRGFSLTYMEGNLVYSIYNNSRNFEQYLLPEGQLFLTYNYGSTYTIGNVSYGRYVYRSLVQSNSWPHIGFSLNYVHDFLPGAGNDTERIMRLAHAGEQQDFFKVTGGNVQNLVGAYRNEPNGGSGTSAVVLSSKPISGLVGDFHYHCTSLGFLAKKTSSGGLYDLNTGENIDPTVTAYGAIFDNGMYINRSGNWSYWYEDGSEIAFTSLNLPPTAGNTHSLFAYAVNNDIVYRVKG